MKKIEQIEFFKIITLVFTGLSPFLFSLSIALDYSDLIIYIIFYGYLILYLWYYYLKFTLIIKSKISNLNQNITKLISISLYLLFYLFFAYKVTFNNGLESSEWALDFLIYNFLIFISLLILLFIFVICNRSIPINAFELYGFYKQPHFPPKWGLLYLILIPYFAGIYTYFFPNQFYHSTLNNEWKSNTIGNLSTELESHFSKTFYLKDKNDIEFYLDDFRVDYNNLIFNLNFRFIKQLNSFNEGQVSIRFSDYRYRTIDFRDKDIWALNIQSTILPNQECIDIINGWLQRLKLANKDLLSNDSSQYSNTFEQIYYIYLDSELSTLINYFKMNTEGFAIGKENNFWRMFYLSSITITTVGFGDIVPVTTSARIMVSIEAILGIVLIGLFLNSVGNQLLNSNKIISDELEKLNKLKEEHVISEKEYAIRKAILLNRGKNT